MNTPLSPSYVKAYIDRHGMSRVQWLHWACASSSSPPTAWTSRHGLFSPPGILAEWGSSRASVGLVMSAAPIGLVLGALAAGPASDRTGRKTMARATGVSRMLGRGRFGGIVGSAVGGVLLTMGWGFSGIVSMLVVPALLPGASVPAARRAMDDDVVVGSGAPTLART